MTFTRKDKKTSTKKIFRKDIQALRALAVISVVLYHLWPERLPGGFTGVDIFLVISGYLMTLSIMRRLAPLADKNSITISSVAQLLADFYARRIRRLVPAALTTIIGVLALAALTNNLSVIVTNAKNAFSAATFWQNWLLAEDSINYLQQDNEIVATQHFWSLSVEEQFYLMWPLLLVITTLLTINIVVLFKREKIPGLILPVTLITLLSLAYGVWLTHTTPTMAYYSTPARIWELMLGGIIALLPIIKNYDFKLVLPYAGLALCLYSIFFIEADGFPGWIALIPTIGTALIILAGTDHAASPLAFENTFRHRFIQWIGNISYSFYLWHFPLIVLLPIILHLDINGPHARLLKIGIIVLSLIFAQLSYRFIEQPAQRLRIRTRNVFILFVAATSAVAGISLFIRYSTEAQIDTNLKSARTAALDENNICFGARALLHKEKCGKPYGNKNSTYTSVGLLGNFHEIIKSRENCYSFHPDFSRRSNTKKYCTVGDESAKRAIILVGDSHIEQYGNAFDVIGKKYHYKVYLASTLMCTTSWERMEKDKLCQERWKNTEELIDSLYADENDSFVMVSTLLMSYNDLASLLKSLPLPHDMGMTLIKDKPRTTNQLLQRCYSSPDGCTRPRSEATIKSTPVMRQLVTNGIIKQDQILDIDDAFCEFNKCYSAIGGVPVYINASHISPMYSYSLAPLLEQRLLQRGILK